MQVAKAVADAVGADRLGIRLSPYSAFLSASDSDPVALYTHLCTELDKLGLAYVHIVTARVAGTLFFVHEKKLVGRLSRAPGLWHGCCYLGEGLTVIVA